ncbi:MAG TPA: DUF2690 domain-containing protein [Symbiobacteriaceae bacterium]|jgi:hypothetical protein
MMKFSTFVKRLGALLGIVAVLSLSLGFAAPHPAAAASGCTSSPSDANCDGQDPGVTGCSNDAQTAATSSVIDIYGHQIGRIVVRYSPTCRSTWAHIVCNAGWTTCTAQINRNDGLSYYASKQFPYAGTAQTTFNSPMVYARGYLVQATSFIQVFGGAYGYGNTAVVYVAP